MGKLKARVGCVEQDVGVERIVAGGSTVVFINAGSTVFVSGSVVFISMGTVVFISMGSTVVFIVGSIVVCNVASSAVAFIVVEAVTSGGNVVGISDVAVSSCAVVVVVGESFFSGVFSAGLVSSLSSEFRPSSNFSRKSRGTLQVQPF